MPLLTIVTKLYSITLTTPGGYQHPEWSERPLLGLLMPIVIGVEGVSRGSAVTRIIHDWGRAAMMTALS